MRISQKCQYALRAIFELAKRNGQGPVKIGEVARVQAIPTRFLEVILRQLKQAGFVDSQRGNEGGYLLTRSPEELSVGDVIRYVQGSIGPVMCVLGEHNNNKCPLYGDCVFLPMWKEVQHAILEVYDKTTFQSLVDREKQMHDDYVPGYSI